jgi:hypothetical protein
LTAGAGGAIMRGRPMEYTIEFEPREAVDVTVTTSGLADRTAFGRLVDELASDARFRPGMNLLFDHTRLDVTPLTTEDIYEIGRAVAEQRDVFARTPIAVVVADPVGYGVTRMAEAQADLPAPDAGRGSSYVRVFYALDEAVEWLRAGAGYSDA